MTWDFLQRYDESWIWRCADRHDIIESSRNFAALDECIADAARHGYVAPHTKAENARRTGRRGGSSGSGKAAALRGIAQRATHKD